LNPYRPLATRLDPAVVARLVEAPATPATAPARTIGISEFAQVELRVARVLSAAQVTGSDKLLQLNLDLGGETRQVFAGIRSSYAPEQLIGRLVIVVANLEPRKMRFGVSAGMVLCASGPEGGIFLLSADSGAQPGMKIS
jgi:methionyl-tRNA synthetase